jgi:hypothetical protein
MKYWYVLLHDPVAESNIDRHGQAVVRQNIEVMIDLPQPGIVNDEFVERRDQVDAFVPYGIQVGTTGKPAPQA